MEIKELQNIIQENGVVGAGGAGFPTYMKNEEQVVGECNTPTLTCYSKKVSFFSLSVIV